MYKLGPRYIKFIYSEKATKFCKIFTLLLTVCTVVESKVKISKKFVAFSEYMNFKRWSWEFQAKVDLVLAVYFTMCTRKIPAWQVDI